MISFASNPAYVGLSLASIILAAFIFLKFRAEQRSLKRKVIFAYGFFSLLVFPLMLFLYTMACSSNPLACHAMGSLEIATILIPGTLVVSLAAGVVGIPCLFIFSTKSRRVTGREARWVQRQARRMGIRTPQLYVIDDARPQAFSFSSVLSAVFISLGAMELLSKKEREAVLIHELGHIRSGASSLKFSALLLKLATPVSAKAFHSTLSTEEKNADDLAAAVQGTRKYLNSAKKKFDAFA